MPPPVNIQTNNRPTDVVDVDGRTRQTYFVSRRLPEYNHTCFRMSMVVDNLNDIRG